MPETKLRNYFYKWKCGKVEILSLWSQVLLSVHSAYNIYLLSFSDQRSEYYALENDCHGAWMNCTGHKSTSSGVQGRKKHDLVVLFSTCLSLPDSPFWYFPRPDWSYCTLPSAQPIWAKPTSCASGSLLQSLSGKQEALGNSGHPPEQGKTLPKITISLTLL